MNDYKNGLFKVREYGSDQEMIVYDVHIRRKLGSLFLVYDHRIPGWRWIKSSFVVPV